MNLDRYVACHPYYLSIYGEYLMNEELAEVTDFKTGERTINKAWFVNDPGIIAKRQE